MSFLSYYFSYIIEQDHASLLMRLHPGSDSYWDEKNPAPKMPPFYPELTKHPSASSRSFNDLLGNIEIYQLEGLEKLERAFFYEVIDYAVLYVAVNFLMDGVHELPSYEHCLLIHRTLIEYRDQEWQSYSVRAIHEALATLNDDLVKLLMEYYS